VYHNTLIIENDVIFNGRLVFSKYSEDDPEYKVIVNNKSKFPVYFRSSPSLFSCGIYDNEKIYYITLTPNYPPNVFNLYKAHNLYFNIVTEIVGNMIKIFRVSGDVNNQNFLYGIDDELSEMENKHPEFCSDVHFVFFFTRKPYTINTYDEYIESMKDSGYAVLGYRDKNVFYITITDTEMKINDYAVNDLLSFVHTLQKAKP
jgi:hypothetical protein